MEEVQMIECENGVREVIQDRGIKIILTTSKFRRACREIYAFAEAEQIELDEAVLIYFGSNHRSKLGFVDRIWSAICEKIGW